MSSAADFNVSFYSTHPTHHETIDNLIQMCRQRLQIYRIISKLQQEKKKISKEDFSESPLFALFSHDDEESSQARITDQVSHFTLFLAYCESPEMFQLFTLFERKWFEVRYESMSIEKQREFRQIHHFHPLTVCNEEMERFQANKNEFKVEWSECLDLVSKHKCLLNSGYAYISEKQLVSWLSQKLAMKLQNQFERITVRTNLDGDERLQVIFSQLNLIKPTNRTSFNSIPVTLNSLEANIRHFPLCMKLHHEKLKRAHHLFHRERLQYARFLKTIGLDVKEAIELFRGEFTKIMTERAFDGEHVYKLKHVYGVVGSRIDYTSYTCDRIQDIEELNAIGCPFKKLSSCDLKCYLGRVVSDENEIESIVEIRNSQNYKLACTACLKFSSGLKFNHNDDDDVIDSPVEYFEQSRNVNFNLEDIYCGTSSDSE